MSETSYIVEILTKFHIYETYTYKNFPHADKTAYASYVNCHKIQGTKKPVMSPSEWLEARQFSMSCVTVGERLGISREAVAAYTSSAIKKIRKIIYNNPTKYRDLIEYIGVQQ